MMALFPFTSVDDLEKEFMISRQDIKALAWLYGIKKTKRYRRRINIKNGKDSFLRKLWAARRRNGTAEYYNRYYRNYERERRREQLDARDNAS